MSYKNKKMFDDDEDDDLESLRLAALKSLSNKRESTTSPPNVGNAIEVLENGPFPRQNLNRNINVIESHRISHLDINEPYIPQNIKPMELVNINSYPYIPNNHTKPSIIPTLSPRSLAFVEQNNDILMRRKGEKSPRSPSPPPYREDSLRWSESPPSQSMSKRHSPILKRGNGGRSPSFHRSPIARRSISRSPKRYSKSPRRVIKSPIRTSRPVNRRSLSRSPVPKYNRNNSRSPLRRNNSPNLRWNVPKRRSISPYNKTFNNKWNNNNNDRLTPPIVTRFRRSSRSPSPVNNRQSDTPPQNRVFRKRSRSPYQNINNIKRSRSRSPSEKVKRSRHHMPVYNNKSYSKPAAENNRKFLNRNNYTNLTRTHKYQTDKGHKRNEDRSRDATRSPSNRQRSKSKTPIISSTNNEIFKPESPKLVNKIQDNVKEIEVKKTEDKRTSPQPIKKSEEELEEELLASTDDEKNSTDNENNNDEDEIDLFASEESESENEGRFKSSSSTNKNETMKKVSTLSYSKLGSASSTTIAELKDINSTGSNRNESSSRDYGRRNNERDRDRKSRSHRNDDIWKNKTSFSRDSRIRLNDNDSRNMSLNDKSSSSSTGTSSMKMFRSTFQAVEELDPKSSKSLLQDSTVKMVEEKPIAKIASEISSEKRGGVLQLKRSTVNSSTRESKHDDNSPSMKQESNVTEPTGKKPIHLRLGAVTGPSRNQSTKSGTSSSSWKNKKSWRIEKV